MRFGTHSKAGSIMELNASSREYPFQPTASVHTVIFRGDQVRSWPTSTARIIELLGYDFGNPYPITPTQASRIN